MGTHGLRDPIDGKMSSEFLKAKTPGAIPGHGTSEAGVHMRISAGITLATAVLVAIPTVGAAKEKTSLEEANRRWAGARCRSRIPISLKEEKPDDGWAKSMWIYRTPEGGNERVRVLLTRSDEIRGRYLGGTLPVGSEFIAVGWKTEKSKDRGKLFLELEHVELGAIARVYYGEDWVGLVEAKGLTEFEHWARLSMFEIVESPSEKLIAVAASAPVVPAGPAPAASVEAGALDIRLLGASTDPLTTSPGRDIALVLTSRSRVWRSGPQWRFRKHGRSSATTRY